MTLEAQKIIHRCGLRKHNVLPSLQNESTHKRTNSFTALPQIHHIQTNTQTHTNNTNSNILIFAQNTEIPTEQTKYVSSALGQHTNRKKINFWLRVSNFN